MLNQNDLKQLEEKGISEETLQSQLTRFEKGFPYLKIEAVATVGHGVKKLSEKEENACKASWKDFQNTGKTIEKFVPASGAASRMFKNIFAFISSGNSQPTTDFEKTYFKNITNFAFFPSLNKVCKTLYNKDIRTLIADGEYVNVAKAMLEKNGLNYEALPKALLQFHKSESGAVHTPLEEHLEEGAQYAADRNKVVNLHFTVSPEHKAEFEKLLKEKISLYESVWGVTYRVTMSEQKSSTDTVAVNMDNSIYREPDGSLLFRPAGHGALIENLNEREADVVFIKNIDNVVPSKSRSITVRYKRIIGGYLIQIQASIAKYLEALEKKAYTTKDLKTMLSFLETTLCTKSTKTADMNDQQLAEYLQGKFNRPVRVCGMVKNEGEPGGGPYLAYNADNSFSPQILEAAQINASNTDAVALMNSGTHFNPVDLVCYLKDYKGNKFNLKDHVDHNTGLISEKSKGGVEIKALELPGLWNGSMSDWNTAFVEVPIETFNPVKTVNDLLRKEHQ